MPKYKKIRTTEHPSLIGPDSLRYTVGSWSPSPDGSTRPIAVALALHVEKVGDVVLRMGSRKSVNQLIDLLNRFADEVFTLPQEAVVVEAEVPMPAAVGSEPEEKEI